jgi:hypothetical protein
MIISAGKRQLLGFDNGAELDEHWLPGADRTIGRKRLLARRIFFEGWERAAVRSHVLNEIGIDLH